MVGLRNVVAMYKIVLAISMKLKVLEQFILSQLVWKLWFIEKGLNKMSASGEELRWESDTEQQGSFLPEYFTYLSLRFKFVVTLTTILMGELVIATVKTTRRLHKPYIVFIANVMVIDIVLTVVVTLISAIMMIGFMLGQGDLIGCNLFYFLHCPVVIVHFTFLMISIDKVIAIKFLFKHDWIMTRHAVVSIIASLWVFAVLACIYILLSASGYTVISRYAVSLLDEDLFLQVLFSVVLLVFTELVGTLSLNIYLAVKAYQVRK